MFESLSGRLSEVFTRLRGRGRLSAGDLSETLRQVRLALLEADVQVGVAKALLERVEARAVGAEVAGSLTPAQQIIKIVHEELVETLGGEAAALSKGKARPLVVLVVGLQGSGKTTTAAKLASRLKGQGRRPLLVAADMQRPAAVDQLQTLGDQAGVEVFVDRSARPTKLAKAALKHAKAGFDAVIIDTAGRLQIDTELMAELADLGKATDPDEILLVVDAMTGQDAVNVALGFAAETDLTGIILTKLDGDARGGAAISTREVTGRPIKFAAVGEGLTDLEVFHPERIASRILGMGDVLTLIEKAEAAWDADQAEAAAEKLMTASFTLEDFLEQFQQLRKMGPLSDVVGMLPGASGLGDAQVSERDLSRVEAIIRSMTPEERRRPKLINGSRRRRIAVGSGTSPQDVNRLLKQHAEAQKMMRSLSEGGGPLAALTGSGARRQQRKQRKRKKR